MLHLSSSWTCFLSDQRPECTCCGGAFVGPLVIRECTPCVSLSPLSSSVPLSPQAPLSYQHLQGKGGGRGYNTCKITLMSPWRRLHGVGLLWVRDTHIRLVIAAISTFRGGEEEGKAEVRRSGTAETNSCQPVKKINACVTPPQLLKITDCSKHCRLQRALVRTKLGSDTRLAICGREERKGHDTHCSLARLTLHTSHHSPFVNVMHIEQA